MAAGKASRSPRAAWKETRGEVLNRGRRSVALDPKKPGALDAALRLIAEADALIEGVRAGVLERLGPAVCHARNPRLVSGRITDWGRDGPPARQAGHDITCLAESTEEAKGDPDLSLSIQELLGKFLDCATDALHATRGDRDAAWGRAARMGRR
jgi:hypothetical protein